SPRYSMVNFITGKRLHRFYVRPPKTRGSSTMAKTILQINYKFNLSHADHAALVTPMADYISSVPGLVWKIWLMNEAEQEAGGIYLFESVAEAQAFASSAPVASFVAHPSLSAFSVKLFEAVESLSKITRGPLTELQKA